MPAIDVSAPDMAIPDVSAPDMAIPDVAIPDVSAPDLDVPDVPDLSAPIADIPDGMAPAATLPTGGLPTLSGLGSVDPVDGNNATIPRGTDIPIGRKDAWRKPLAPDASTPVADATVTTPGRPEVVDLAIPQEAPIPVAEPKGRNWKMIGGVLLSILALIVIAWLISSLFAGNDTATTQTEAPANTEASADADATSETEAPTAAETTSAQATEASEPATSEGDSSVFELRAGDCIVGDIGAGQVTRVEKVDCEQEHQFEVYREALIDSSITVFDEAEISAYAEDVCRTALENYVPNDERGLKFKFLQPTEDSWNQEDSPDRVVTCLLFDENGPLIGRAG